MAGKKGTKFSTSAGYNKIFSRSENESPLSARDKISKSNSSRKGEDTEEEKKEKKEKKGKKEKERDKEKDNKDDVQVDSLFVSNEDKVSRKRCVMCEKEIDPTDANVEIYDDSSLVHSMCLYQYNVCMSQ